MNKKLFTAITVMFALTGFAQDYTVKMNVKMEGLPPEYAAMGEQEIVTYLKGDKSKTEMTSMMGSNTVFFDGKVLTSLSDQMGNKTGFTATKEELEAMDKDKPKTKPAIQYTDEKKLIAGYECKKAVVTTVDADKKENKTTVWYTDKIKHDQSMASKARGRNSLDLSELKGYPLGMEMAMNNQGMEIKLNMMATEVTEGPLAESMFTPSTEGYKMMTYKEAQEMQKGMQRGGK
jgi:hypothetical protein